MSQYYVHVKPLSNFTLYLNLHTFNIIFQCIWNPTRARKEHINFPLTEHLGMYKYKPFIFFRLNKHLAENIIQKAWKRKYLFYSFKINRKG